MIIFRILNFLAGYRRVSCPAERTADAVNLLMREEIDYWELKREENGELTFSILEREYKHLLSLADGLPFRSLCRYGLPQWIGRYRKRLGIPLGFLIFLLLTKLSTQYIWEVTVSGNETLTDAEVQECLEELGCGIGSYIPSVDFYNICHEFILANEDVSWISVNMVGTTARVELIEASCKGQIDNGGNGTPSNLLAACDGEVVRTETASGMLVVKAGQTVTKGQLLVSGVVDVGRNEDGRFVLVRSRAKVFAKTNRTLEVVVPYETVKKTVVGRETVKKSLKFFGKTIKLKENSSILPEGCDIIEENRRIVLFEGDKLTGGIPLPIRLITFYRETIAEERVTLTEEEALIAAGIEMATLMERELPDAEILSRTVKVENRMTEEGDALVLTWEMTCIEDIAVESPIGVE